MAVASGYFRTPPVVKNLLIINTLIFLVQIIVQRSITGGMSLTMNNPLVYYGALQFNGGAGIMHFLSHSYQLVTYMFLHGSFSHLFFNMFTLWMFGRILEEDLGTKRFLIFYMICGMGAGLIQLGVNWFEFVTGLGPMHALTVGASGAIFGLLIGFGMFRPNSVIMLLFPPIPMKAKWFVLIYAGIELFLGVRGGGGTIAHFAHVGGMLVGWLLLLYWKRKRYIFF